MKTLTPLEKWSYAIGNMPFAVKDAAFVNFVVFYYTQVEGLSGSLLGHLVGLFSRLHKMLNIPLAELILPLPFSEDMRAAILEQSGRIGRLLKFAQTIENADEGGIDFMQTNMRLPAVQVYDAYNEAYDWMGEIEGKWTNAA